MAPGVQPWCTSPALRSPPILPESPARTTGPFAHPVWLVGFRPFFTLAFVAAVVLPLAWAAVFSGHLTLPVLAPVQWHAHEMLFGFGGAVLFGFLLTASKNWTKTRGMHGGPLALAAALWVLERFAFFLPAGVVREVLLHVFGVYVVGYVLWTLLRFHAQDAFKDNWFFVVGLPLLLVGRALLLRPGTWEVGVPLALGIFRLAFAVMLERTMRPFMQAAHKVELRRIPALDLGIKVAVLVAAFEAVLPPVVAAAVLALAAVLLFVRLLLWQPLVGLRTFGVGVMYVGSLGLVLHLALAAASRLGALVAVGTLATHTFSFLVMGLIIPAMLVRICQGHTGRKLAFTASDKVAICVMGLGGVLRLVAPQVAPAQYTLWVSAAAACWSLCFLVLGVRLVPYLVRPRVDGKEH